MTRIELLANGTYTNYYEGHTQASGFITLEKAIEMAKKHRPNAQIIIIK